MDMIRKLKRGQASVVGGVIRQPEMAARFIKGYMDLVWIGRACWLIPIGLIRLFMALQARYDHVLLVIHASIR